MALNWQPLPGTAHDIGVRASGWVWVTGTVPVTGGFAIFKWDGNNWNQYQGNAVRIAVGPNGEPWVVTSDGSIFVLIGDQFQRLPGAAHDIGVGADGSAWIIGTSPLPGGFAILRWNGANWIEVQGSAVRISVGPEGTPWVVNDAGGIFVLIGDQFQRLPGTAHDIGVGADGSVWVIGTNPLLGGFGIFQWDGVSNWIENPGGATQIAVGPDGTPWVVNDNGVIYHGI